MQIMPAGQSNALYAMNNQHAGAAFNNTLQPATRTDRVDISPQGKLASLLEGLEKKKEGLIQQKEDLITKTLERGGSMESIEKPLEYLDEQLETLKEQIADTIAQHAARQAQQLTEQKAAREKDEAGTPEDAESRRVHAMTKAAGGFEQAKTLQATGNRAAGEAGVKEGEARLDADRLDFRKYIAKNMGAVEKAFLRQAKAVAKATMTEARQELKRADAVMTAGDDLMAEVNREAERIGGAGQDTYGEQEEAR